VTALAIALLVLLVCAVNRAVGYIRLQPWSLWDTRFVQLCLTFIIVFLAMTA
jgi:hypothetical protein